MLIFFVVIYFNLIVHVDSDIDDVFIFSFNVLFFFRENMNFKTNHA